jgi:hypothetical protein
VLVKDVMPGDVIVYKASPADGGEIEHSGIVIREPQGVGGLVGVPLIVSKWGNAGEEMIHYANEGPYSQYSILYYRVVR